MTTTLTPTISLAQRTPISRETLLAALLLTLACTLRFTGITQIEVWQDEAYSVLVAASHRGVWTELRIDTNPPLYYLLLKAWIALFGISAVAIRSLSAVFGTGAVLLLGLWVRQLGYTSRTALWAIALAAVAPMHIYYSQETRPYALMLLLGTAALWSYTRALESTRWRDWLLLSAFLAAAFYTHPLCIPWTAAFWITTALLRPPRKTWIRLLGANAVAAVAYLPGAILLSTQAAASGGIDWIADFWNHATPLFPFATSLEALSIGGKLPHLVQWRSMDEGFRWFSIALAALTACAALLPRARHSADPGSTRTKPLPLRLILVIFILWPLLDIWLYSILRKPIYLPARYDLLAMPPLLILLALGIDRITSAPPTSSPIRRAAAWTTAAALLTVMAWGWYQRFSMHLPPSEYPQTLLGTYMKDAVAPNDTVICLGLEGSVITYQCQLRSIPCTIETLPRETLSHLGWIETPAHLARRHDEIQTQITALLHQAAATHSSHLWLILPKENTFPWEGPPAGINDLITRMFFDQAHQAGWTDLPENQQLSQTLRIAALTPKS